MVPIKHVYLQRHTWYLHDAHCMHIVRTIAMYELYVRAYVSIDMYSACISEGKMIRFETLIELKRLNSSFSSSSSYRKQTKTSIYRAVRGNSIQVNSTLLLLAFTPAEELLLQR